MKQIVRLDASRDPTPGLGSPPAHAGLRIDLDRPRALACLLDEAVRGAVTSGGIVGARSVLEQAAATGPPASLVTNHLVLDRRRFAGARIDPTSLTLPAAFQPTPVRCRRAIGLDAVDRCIRGRAHSIVEAVADVLGCAQARLDASEAGSTWPWWARWWASLPAGGRAAVQGEAITWATRLWTAVDWASLAGRATVVTRDQRWAIPGCRWCQLVGRAELRVEGLSGCALLVVGVGGASPGWQYDLGLPALVSALSGGLDGSCDRVVGWWPDSGQVRALVLDDQLLLEVAEAVASVVHR